MGRLLGAGRIARSGISDSVLTAPLNGVDSAEIEERRPLKRAGSK